MESTNDILRELSTISELVAGLKKVNVFTVPQGYFESVSDTLLACIKEEKGINPVPVSTDAAGIPAGYFDQLAGSILQKIKSSESAMEETRYLSPLLQTIQPTNVFEVPDGYFDGVSNAILNQLPTAGSSRKEISELSPLLHQLQHNNVFEVPVGYFEGLGTDILHLIPESTGSNAAFNTMSTMLLNIKDINVFEVPGNYFEKLAENILQKVQPSTGKLVKMHRRGRWLQYAVAAMMTGVIALGLYKYIDKTGSSLNNTQTVTTLDAAIIKGRAMDDQQFKEALGSLTEADIAKYLVTNGDITDVAVLKNNLDANNLPSEEEYLMDETTLDKFIQEIEQPLQNN